MLKIKTAVLLGLALVLVSVLTTAAYFRTTVPVSIVSVPAANAVFRSVDLPMAAAAPVAGRSLYLSEQTLRARLDLAYERGPESEVQRLLHILNGRYEHRCCGLPR
jgi:hypothetical protein